MWRTALAYFGPWRSALVTGAGFGLACGWVWFPGPQNMVLPHALWGTAFSGGAALFSALGLVGFALAACLLFKQSRPARFLTSNEDLTPLAYAGRLHGAALACMALALAPLWPTWGLWAYAGAIFLALAALLLGVFWGGAMLTLPGGWPGAGAAFATACVTAMLTGLTGDALQGWYAVVFWLIPPAMAWRLTKVAQGLFAEPRRDSRTVRPRGRPRRNEPGAVGEAGETGELGETPPLNPKDVWTAALAFWVLALGGERALAPGLAELCMACGALLALWARHCGWSPRGLLAAALTARGAALLAASAWIDGLAGALAFTEGAMLATLFMLLCGVPPMRACFRAASALAALPLLSNTALLAGTALTGMVPQPYALLPAGGASVLTACALLLWGIKRPGVVQVAAQTAVQPEEEARQDTALPATVDREEENAAPRFTPQEISVLELHGQGLTVKDMAARLGVRQDTVRWHLRNIQRKGGEKLPETRGGANP